MSSPIWIPQPPTPTQLVTSTPTPVSSPYGNYIPIIANGIGNVTLTENGAGSQMGMFGNIPMTSIVTPTSISITMDPAMTSGSQCLKVVGSYNPLPAGLGSSNNGTPRWSCRISGFTPDWFNGSYQVLGAQNGYFVCVAPSGAPNLERVTGAAANPMNTATSGGGGGTVFNVMPSGSGSGGGITAAGGSTTITTMTQHFSVDEIKFKDGIEVSSRTDEFSLGKRVTDVSLKPYLREMDVQFAATKMRANTKVYAFFDDQAVGKYCRPINGNFGDQLVTDKDGAIIGIFKIPEGKFFVGQREFKLSGDPLGGSSNE